MSITQTEPIYGVFNGQAMEAEDGKIYPVAPNYASKSKLAEGDELKLVFGEDGSFIYKQVKRQDTKRLRGIVRWTKNDCFVAVGPKSYRILYPTATYFKLRDGDEVVLLVPIEREVSWAAVENVIRVPDDEVELKNS